MAHYNKTNATPKSLEATTTDWPWGDEKEVPTGSKT